MSSNAEKRVQLEELRNRIVEEYKRKYLAMIDSLESESASNVISISVRKFMDSMTVKKLEFRDNFVRDVKFALGDGGKLTERDLEVIAEAFENQLSDIISAAITSIHESIAAYYKFNSDTVARKARSILKEMLNEMIDLRLRMSELEKRMMSLKGMIRQKYMDKDTMYKVLAILEDKGPMTVTDVAAEIRRSETTARRYLDVLVNKHYVARDKRKKPYVYKFVKAPWTV